VVGIGLGVSDLLITNNRTIGLPATGDSAPYASFSAENEYTQRRNFTWDVLVGLEYSYCADWAVSTGYRWFNAGEFKGPQYLRTATGAAVDINCDTWNMRLKTNEWFVEFKIFI
jgi:opacity protein-like surface antigen